MGLIRAGGSGVVARWPMSRQKNDAAMAGGAMQTVLRVWFLATGVLIGTWAIWVFVPVLVPILGLAAMMVVPVAAVVSFARWLERRRGGPHVPLK